MTRLLVQISVVVAAIQTSYKSSNNCVNAVIWRLMKLWRP